MIVNQYSIAAFAAPEYSATAPGAAPTYVMSGPDNTVLPLSQITGASVRTTRSPDTMAASLGQLAGASAVLAASVMEKRRERAARKKSGARIIEDYLKRGEHVVPTPSPSYKPARRIVEAALPGPDPRSARTPEEFVSKMRQLKAYAGQTLRGAEDCAGKLGELPKSTLHDALKSKSLPKPLLLRRFLASCGLTDEQIAVWESAYKRIAMEQVS